MKLFCLNQSIVSFNVSASGRAIKPSSFLALSWLICLLPARMMINICFVYRGSWPVIHEKDMTNGSPNHATQSGMIIESFFLLDTAPSRLAKSPRLFQLPEIMYFSPPLPWYIALQAASLTGCRFCAAPLNWGAGQFFQNVFRTRCEYIPVRLECVILTHTFLKTF